MVERLAAESFAFTRHAGSPDDRRAAVAANRLILRISLKSNPTFIGNVWQQVPPFMGPELRSSKEPDWATAPRGAKAKPAEQAPGD